MRPSVDDRPNRMINVAFSNLSGFSSVEVASVFSGDVL